MNLASALRLLALSAAWGGSFLLLRMGASALGPAVLIEGRLLFAALFLSLMAVLLSKAFQFAGNWRHFALLGLANTALPFLLLGYSAQTLNASMMSVLNAAAPIFGAIIGACWDRQAPPKTTVLGLLLGTLGVAIVVGLDPITLDGQMLVAVAASLTAAFSYGFASNYTRRSTKLPAFTNAHGSMWAAALMVLPLALLFPSPTAIDSKLLLLMLILGVVCTGIAYLLYFRLVEEVGATSALTVTYLVPLFGVLWGHLVLDEPLSSNILLGGVVVLLGTSLVTGTFAQVIHKLQR
ncbi:DMT family transporter [Ferrimonas senticii]|uniref:DMT family transporter n=1 Tax=Ferrimonas senticii TaxID=394566 RepID=UPI000400610F|nr:DMT family transporter [Ferrimonas senticii]